MTRVHIFTAAALAVLAPSPARGQQVLMVEQAVQQALARNASLRGARAASAENTARVSEARAGWFPRVSVGESWQRGDQPVYVFSSLLSSREFAASNFAIDSLNHPDATSFFHTSIGVEQLVFDGGRQRAAVEAASLQRDIAALSADEAAAGVALQTTEAYGHVVAAEAGRRAADAALAAAREDLTRATARRDAGMASDADVLVLAAHVADLQQRAIQLAGDAAIARAELNRLMGAPVDAQYDIPGPQPAGETAALPALDALLAEADAARPELKRAAASGRLADAGRTAARSALVPQVAAQAAYELGGTRFGDRASSWLVGANVRWNLSLGGAELARMQAAADAGARAAAEADETRAAVHVEVVAALRRLEAAQARQAAGRAAVEQARESQRIIRDRYEAGIVSVSDVLRASTAVLDAEARRAAAFVDEMVGRAMLNRAVGRHP